MATSKEYHDYVIECLSKAGNVTTKKMMGEYCVYYNGKLIGDICDSRLLIKQTDTSKRLLADCRLEYPYKGSKTLMYVVEEFENTDLMQELLEGLYAELPAKKK
ncbi:MAG: competence protein TfoX [Syntrophomonadaceae bacterium]|jgi:TfoX/Sxy family transcriptional regulator of competence genes|nr:competence protein TfoX [Syntrophomonadaceae bacterium]